MVNYAVMVKYFVHILAMVRRVLSVICHLRWRRFMGVFSSTAGTRGMFPSTFSHQQIIYISYYVIHQQAMVCICNRMVHCGVWDQ